MGLSAQFASKLKYSFDIKKASFEKPELDKAGKPTGKMLRGGSFIRKLYITGTESPLMEHYRITAKRKVDKPTGKVSWTFSIRGIPFPTKNTKFTTQPLVLNTCPDTVIGPQWNSAVAKTIRQLGGKPGDECYEERQNHLDDKFTLRGKPVDTIKGIRAMSAWLDTLFGKGVGYSLVYPLCNANA